MTSGKIVKNKFCIKTCQLIFSEKKFVSDTTNLEMVLKMIK